MTVVNLDVVKFEIVDEPIENYDVELVAPLGLPLPVTLRQGQRYPTFQLTGYEAYGMLDGKYVREYRARVMLAGPLEISIKTREQVGFEAMMDERERLRR